MRGGRGGDGGFRRFAASADDASRVALRAAPRPLRPHSWSGHYARRASPTCCCRSSFSAATPARTWWSRCVVGLACRFTVPPLPAALALRDCKSGQDSRVALTHCSSSSRGCLAPTSALRRFPPRRLPVALLRHFGFRRFPFLRRFDFRRLRPVISGVRCGGKRFYGQTSQHAGDGCSRPPTGTPRIPYPARILVPLPPCIVASKLF